MCRSSSVSMWVKMIAVALGVALLSSSGRAQVYGFPSDVGVIDDGYGTLPPEPRLPRGPYGVALVDTGLPLPAPSAAMPHMPPCPLVIRVGGGLRHAARTRVTYGRPGCS